MPDELLACLADQGTEVGEGDVLLVRFGWISWYLEQDADKRAWLGDRATFRSAGLHPGEDTCRTLWNLHIAALGCDNPGVEIWPRGSHLEPDVAAEALADMRRVHEVFAHTMLLPMLGLPLGELFFLDDLAADCAADGKLRVHVHLGAAQPPARRRQPTQRAGDQVARRTGSDARRRRRPLRRRLARPWAGWRRSAGGSRHGSASPLRGGLDRRPHPLGRARHVDVAHAEVRHGVDHRVLDRRRRADRRRLADALGAERVDAASASRSSASRSSASRPPTGCRSRRSWT